MVETEDFLIHHRMILDTLSNIITVRGVYVGGKDLMRDMVRAIEANDIHPVVDKKVFYSGYLGYLADLLGRHQSRNQ
jgi:hypothetical protein